MIILLPAFFYLRAVPDFGRLQTNDYYGVFPQLAAEDGESLTRNPRRWLRVRSNEHRATIPVMLWAANYHLNGGSNVGLSLFSLAMMFLCTVLLVSWLPESVRRRDGTWMALGVLISFFGFTTVAAHNVMRGFSGTQWLLSNALSIAALTILFRRGNKPGLLPLWPIPLLGLAGAFTYSTSYSLWPALIYAAWRLGLSRKKVGAFAMLALIVLGYFAIAYKTPNHGIALNTHSPSLALQHFAIYFGSIFSKTPALATLLGSLALLASLLLHLGSTRKLSWLPLDSREIAPFLAIQLFSAGNAIGTAIGRSELGANQAMASRYATLAALFWIGLLVPLGIALVRDLSLDRRRRIALTSSFAIGAGLLVGAMLYRGHPLLENHIGAAQRQPAAELALVYGVRDQPVLRNLVCPEPKAVWEALPFLKSLKHVPFEAGERTWPTGRARKIEIRPAADKVHGYVDSLSEIEDGLFRVGGWVHAPEDQVRGVLLLDERKRRLGPTELGLVRNDIEDRLGKEARYTGWTGYARLRPNSEVVRAYVLLEDEHIGYELEIAPRIASWWQNRQKRDSL